MGFFGKLFGEKNNVAALVNSYMTSNVAPDDAMTSLKTIKDENLVRLLIQALQDEKWGNRRRRAANALGEVGDKTAVKSLVQTLNDLDVMLRKATAGALIKIGDADSVEALIKSLQDTDRGVRMLSASALGKIGDSRAVEPLMHALSDKEEDVRWYSAIALGEIGDSRSIETLSRALHDKSELVCQSAQDALKKMNVIIEEQNDLVSFKNIKLFEELLLTKYNILNKTYTGIIEPSTYIDILGKIEEEISIYLNIGKTMAHESVFRIAVFPKNKSPQSSRACIEFIGLGVFNQDPSKYLQEQCVTAKDIGLIKGRIMSRLISTGRLTASAKDYKPVTVNQLRNKIKQRKQELGLKGN